MPKFKVRKGQDAYVVYQTIVEAEDAETAGHIAGSIFYKGDWAFSHISEFDDYELFYEDTEEVADDFVLEEIAQVELSPAERDTVLAALRLWQKTPEDTRAYLRDIFTNDDHHTGVADDDIDALCERINV